MPKRYNAGECAKRIGVSRVTFHKRLAIMTEVARTGAEPPALLPLPKSDAVGFRYWDERTVKAWFRRYGNEYAQRFLFEKWLREKKEAKSGKG